MCFSLPLPLSSPLAQPQPEHPDTYILAMPFPLGKDEVKAYIKKHHYSRRCPGVWTIAYALVSARNGRLKAVSVIASPPYPSIVTSFFKPETRPEMWHSTVAWQARLAASAVSREQLDDLLQQSNLDLRARGYRYVVSLTEATARVIEPGGLFANIRARGYTGEVYHRNEWAYCGETGRPGQLEGWIKPDGTILHIRQGAVTLSQRKAAQLYPGVKLRAIRTTGTRSRWLAVLADDPAEQARLWLLTTYRRQEWRPAVQHILFSTSTTARAKPIPTIRLLPALNCS